MANKDKICDIVGFNLLQQDDKGHWISTKHDDLESAFKEFVGVPSGVKNIALQCLVREKGGTVGSEHYQKAFGDILLQGNSGLEIIPPLIPTERYTTEALEKYNAVRAELNSLIEMHKEIPMDMPLNEKDIISRAEAGMALEAEYLYFGGQEKEVIALIDSIPAIDKSSPDLINRNDAIKAFDSDAAKIFAGGSRMVAKDILIDLPSAEESKNHVKAWEPPKPVEKAKVKERDDGMNR